MDMINLKINDISIEVPDGITVLEAAKYANVEIPTLCYLKDINEIGACRICLVEIKGGRALAAACTLPATDGMEVFTNTPEIRKSRKGTLELLVSDHDRQCLSCVRSGSCQLQKLCTDYGIDENKFAGERHEFKIDDESAAIVRDNNKCVLCKRCVAMCRDVQSVSVIDSINRGFKTYIACAFDHSLGEVACVYCGQCIVACPTGALQDKDDTAKVLGAIADKNKKVYVFAAPSIHVTIAEAFDMPLGSNTKGKLAGALKRLGFDGVFDMNLTADLTIMEESAEFIDRLNNGGKLPIITSCSPGWVKFCEHFFPELTDNLSTCKSPQQMFGALLKTYFAQKNNIDPKDIFVVSVIPCTAKKFEATREGEAAAGVPDVDVALTTRELARMLKADGIDYKNLPDDSFDSPFEEGTGAGQIFGASGGVMEAALRTASHMLGEDTDIGVFDKVRGKDGIRRATYKIGGKEVKVAVVSGLSNARELMDAVSSGKEEYHMIEVMACQGGCINGGGQPLLSDTVRNNVDISAIRTKAIYDADENSKIRRSYESPEIKRLYDEYFEKPGSHKAHKILHTEFKKRCAFY